MTWRLLCKVFITECSGDQWKQGCAEIHSMGSEAIHSMGSEAVHSMGSEAVA